MPQQFLQGNLSLRRKKNSSKKPSSKQSQSFEDRCPPPRSPTREAAESSSVFLNEPKTFVFDDFGGQDESWRTKSTSSASEDTLLHDDTDPTISTKETKKDTFHDQQSVKKDDGAPKPSDAQRLPKTSLTCTTLAKSPASQHKPMEGTAATVEARRSTSEHLGQYSGNKSSDSSTLAVTKVSLVKSRAATTKMMRYAGSKHFPFTKRILRSMGNRKKLETPHLQVYSPKPRDDTLQQAFHRLLTASIVPIQRMVRHYLAKRGEKRMAASVAIQAIARGWQVRSSIRNAAKMEAQWYDELMMQHEAAIVIQSAFRGYRDYVNYQFDMDDIITLQSLYRQFVAKRAAKQEKAAVMKQQEKTEGLVKSGIAMMGRSIML